MAHLRAAALLLTWLALLVLATPGMDALGEQALARRGERSRLYETYPRPIAELGLWLVAVNRTLRQPLAASVGRLEEPLRIDQDWGVFRDGPDRYSVLDIRVDSRLVYRTNDPEHAWRVGQLRNRHVRPAVDSFVDGGEKPIHLGLTAWLCEAARTDFPEARRVDILAMWGPFPGDERKVHHRVECFAPAWRVVRR